jgi:hypothetical protein
MFFVSFIAGRVINEINTFSSYDLGRSIVFPIFFTGIPHLICLIGLGLIWLAKKRIWRSYYHMAWFIWAILMIFMIWTKYILNANY